MQAINGFATIRTIRENDNTQLDIVGVSIPIVEAQESIEKVANREFSTVGMQED